MGTSAETAELCTGAPNRPASARPGERSGHVWKTPPSAPGHFENTFKAAVDGH